jgi:hypothetical protein
MGIGMTKRAFAATAASICLLACQSAGAQAPKVADFPLKNGMVIFMMPSKNIECTFVPKQTAIYMPPGGGPELTCDRRDPTYVRIVLGPAKAAERTDNPGEQPCCGGDNTLEYGQTWTGGPFTCQSTPTGLVCRHQNGHGFSVSQKRIEVH